jgi:hypothetical protein
MRSTKKVSLGGTSNIWKFGRTSYPRALTKLGLDIDNLC